MRVCPEACSLFWAALSLACFWYSRCRLEQAWHRVSSGMGGAPHSTQMPRSLALSLLSWVLRRINSLRSGVWARWRSYSRRFSCLASSSARVGSTRGFGVLDWGVAFRDVFTAGLFQLWGCPPLLAGFGREKVNSKVWPIAHSCRRILHRRLQLVLLTPVQDGGEPPVCSKTKPWAPPWRKLASQFPMV